jgi:type I restriction enzyme, S subunit
MKTLLERHFDTAFDAPDGIKRLRELILSLAMQGKLVKQDPNDPPASELLKEIEAEKKRLIKAGNIRQPKPLPPINPEEIPYKLPKSWEWVRLIEVGYWALGSGLPHDIQGSMGQEILLCKVSDMNLPGNEKFILVANNTVSEEVAKKQKLSISPPGTIIFPKIGGAIATNKRRILHTRTVIDNNCLGITPWSVIDLEWMYQLLVSFDFQKYQTGTSVPAISQGTIGEIVIGLPPLSEQHRLVAKIDQLMARCDALEKLRTDRDQKRLIVHAVAIRQLLDPASLPSRPQHVQPFLFSHFPELYAVKENVTELSKAILQLAVMGKLVPQDPNDPPASELLKEIDAEKKRLVKAGKIKQPKPLPPIKPEEIPYNLPKSWAWVRLGEIVSLLGDGIHGTPKYDETGDYFFVNGNNLNDGVIDFKTNTKRVSFFEFQKHKKELTDKTVLVSINGTIGNVAFYNGEKVLLGKSACYFNLFSQIEKQYIKKLIQCDYFIKHAFGTATGTTIKNVSLKTMREFCVPLPPLPEQHRIVAKVDQLMALVDAMENQITSATHKQTTLLTALMARV